MNKLEQAVAGPSGGMCTLVIFIFSNCAHAVDLEVFLYFLNRLRIAGTPLESGSALDFQTYVLLSQPLNVLEC